MDSEINKQQFPNGGPCSSLEESIRLAGLIHSIRIDESERQAILLALAELSIARPGWVYMLEQIAFKMDNKDENGHAEMFEGFRYNHVRPMVELLAQ